MPKGGGLPGSNCRWKDYTQMKTKKIDFYSEVIVNNLYPGDKKGRKGVVLGISEENGILYGYSVALHGEKITFFLDKKYAIPTGKMFSREDFY